MLAALYGLYLLYLGIKQLKDVPPDKQMIFFIVTIAVAIVIQVIISQVVSAIAFPKPTL